jgi:hypothetical protein
MNRDLCFEQLLRLRGFLQKAVVRASIGLARPPAIQGFARIGLSMLTGTASLRS